MSNRTAKYSILNIQYPVLRDPAKRENIQYPTEQPNTQYPISNKEYPMSK